MLIKKLIKKLKEFKKAYGNIEVHSFNTVCTTCHSRSTKFVGLKNYSEFLAGRMTLDEWRNSPTKDIVSCSCKKENENE